jgi:hypothetical protein
MLFMCDESRIKTMAAGNNGGGMAFVSDVAK